MVRTELELRQAIKEAEGRKRVRVAGVRGLVLDVSKGALVWRLRYKLDGKHRWLKLGEYPAMGLREARKEAERWRGLIARGEDPRALLEAQKAEREKPVFEEVARRWLETIGASWSEGRRRKSESWLARDVFPLIGDKHCDEIIAQDVLRVLKRIEAAGHLHKLRRVQSDLRRIFSFAITHGYCDANPVEAIVSRDTFRKEQTQHRPALITAEGAARLMQAIREYPNPIVRGGLLMLAYTLARPGEVRRMRWDEIDETRAQWRYTMTKTGQPHVCPLPRQALAVLEELRPLTGSTPFVFVGQARKRGPFLSENAFNQALRRMGFDTANEHCAHGFRAMGRTLLAEMGFPPEWIERQLGHRQPSDTIAAYAREKLLPQRTRMMQRWADWLDEIAEGKGVVVPIRARG